MKKSVNGFLGIGLVMCILWSAITPSVIFAAEELPITVLVNGGQVAFDVEPVMEQGRVLVPMRFIFEALGATVTWDGTERAATATKEDNTIIITVDDTQMMKNGEAVLLDVPARLIDGRTLVPVRAVSEGMGADVDWNGEGRQVIIVDAVDVPVVHPTTTPVPLPTSTPNPSPAGKLPYTELSEKDMQRLKDSYDNLIRYGFEQSEYPKAVLMDNEEIVKEIKLKSEAAKQLAMDVWNQAVITKILEIQIDSDTEYEMVETDKPDEMKENYQKLVKEAKLEASDYFEISFEKLEDGSTMMLLSFYETDTLVACKYIGVVVRTDDSVRYFTAETDLLDQNHLYLCEVTTKGRGTIGAIRFEKENFVNGVNMALKKGMGIEG